MPRSKRNKKFKRQNRSKRIKKTQEEIAIENQINALRQRLAIVRSQRQNQPQNQNQPQRQNQPIIKNETGKPYYEMISDTPRNNFKNVILRYKVINFESNNMESYLNNILKWVRTRVFTGWKKKI